MGYLSRGPVSVHITGVDGKVASMRFRVHRAKAADDSLVQPGKAVQDGGRQS